MVYHTSRPREVEKIMIKINQFMVDYSGGLDYDLSEEEFNIILEYIELLEKRPDIGGKPHQAEEFYDTEEGIDK